MRINIYDSQVDIAFPETDVEVEVSGDGQTVWVNLEGKTVCRIGKIKQAGKEVIIRDNRVGA